MVISSPPREGRDEVREETLAVDSAVNVSLGEQLLQNLKRAISRGVYQPGERLPGVHALAAQAGVSTKVSRQALARLAKIGWCESRRGTRSVVADRGKDRRGRVLFFNAETGFGFPSCDWSQALSLSPNLQTALTEFAPLITAMTAIESMAAAGMDLLLSRRTAGG